LQTAFAAETHLAEGQWLKKQVNMVKLRMFRAGTRRPTVSRAEGQYLVPLKPFIKNKASIIIIIIITKINKKINVEYELRRYRGR
jgi:hypothetical protein